MFLGKIKPTLFHKKERIVRHIYSPYSFNDKTNQLRPNFLQFVFQDESQKNELSSTRFEVETLNHCRIVGKHHSDPSKKRGYYGFACTSAGLIYESNSNYSIFYSPTNRTGILNYSHCDIYDNSEPIPKGEKGEALAARIAHEKEVFLKAWLPYIDREDIIKKSFIEPPVSL